MNVLGSGAGGMVGSHIAEMLYNRGNNLIGICHKKNIEQVEFPVKFIQCDLSYAQGIDETLIDNLLQQVYHLAVQSYPTVSWVSPVETIDVNINSTINIYKVVKKARKCIESNYYSMVVVACTSAEYGEKMNQLEGVGELKVKETAQLQPLHPYVVSKVGQDSISSQYFMIALIFLANYNISYENTYQMSDVVALIEEEIDHKPEVKLEPSLIRSTDEKIIVGDVNKWKRDTGWKQVIFMRPLPICWTIGGAS